MLKVGTKVKVHMKDPSNSVLIKLLNTLEGEIVGKTPGFSFESDGYEVAYESEHLEAIQKATNEHFDTKVKVQLRFVHLCQRLKRPKDTRYHMLAFKNEVTPA